MAIPTAAEIEAIRERRSKITPPPWVHDSWAVGVSSQFIKQPEADHRVLCECRIDQSFGMDHHPRHDFKFIESAPDDIDTLLAALDAVTAERDYLLRNREAMSKVAILSDEASASRERDLKEQLDAVTLERDRLRVAVDGLETLWTICKEIEGSETCGTAAADQ